ncbi:uncharacterized protein PV06_11928 [Exophiala oligosperma]|uniref:Uncharacterized protein n=1 Tax=Exophiala oligosperma TaxID=215243 RepID=A0A0D2A5U0_9EURO|nr:uncharacterized protein PV06_11928 [Exophiala oligosperma]KIW35731.1 hypothetical protein PV06_11928 [Exophiala oligosperma]
MSLLSRKSFSIVAPQLHVCSSAERNDVALLYGIVQTTATYVMDERRVHTLDDEFILHNEPYKYVLTAAAFRHVDQEADYDLELSMHRLHTSGSRSVLRICCTAQVDISGETVMIMISSSEMFNAHLDMQRGIKIYDRYISNKGIIVIKGRLINGNDTDNFTIDHISFPLDMPEITAFSDKVEH